MICVSSTDPVPQPIGARGCATGCGGRAAGGAGVDAAGVGRIGDGAGWTGVAGTVGAGAENAGAEAAGPPCPRGAVVGDGTPPAARTSCQVRGAWPVDSGDAAVGTGRAAASRGGRVIGVGVPAARAPPPPKTEDRTGCPCGSDGATGSPDGTGGRPPPLTNGHREVVAGDAGVVGTAPVSALGK